MASISEDELRSEITAILKDADLTLLSSKKVRKQLENTFKVDLTERKKEIDKILMAEMERAEENEKKEDDATSESDSDFSAPEDVGPPVKKVKKSKRNDEAIAREMQEEEDSMRRRTRHGPKKARKKKTSDSSEKTKSSTGYHKPMQLSPVLAKVMGTDMMPRAQVVKKLWAIIKERELQDPKQKAFMLCDDELYEVFRQRRVKCFTMMKYLKDHIYNPEETVANDEDGTENGELKPIPESYKPSRPTGVHRKEARLSPELAAVMGEDTMRRSEVVKKMWALVRERDLLDPTNKQYTICDEQLFKVIGIKRFKTFSMMKYLKHHMSDSS